jgi:transcriptional regulator with XRE-family HTH domain
MNTTIQIAPRQRLVAERLRRRLTQLEVADQLGTTPGNVSRWERGLTSPGPYFRSRLCELFGGSARELGLIGEEHDDPLTLHTLAPSLAASFQRDASARSSSPFTDRGELLALWHALMRPDTAEALSSVPAHSGQGELHLPERESMDQAWLTQMVAQSLQELILENTGAVVLVVSTNNVSSQTSVPRSNTWPYY